MVSDLSLIALLLQVKHFSKYGLPDDSDDDDDVDMLPKHPPVAKQPEQRTQQQQIAKAAGQQVIRFCDFSFLILFKYLKFIEFSLQ